MSSNITSSANNIQLHTPSKSKTKIYQSSFKHLYRTPHRSKLKYSSKSFKRRYAHRKSHSNIFNLSIGKILTSINLCFYRNITPNHITNKVQMSNEFFNNAVSMFKPRRLFYSNEFSSNTKEKIQSLQLPGIY